MPLGLFVHATVKCVEFINKVSLSFPSVYPSVYIFILTRGILENTSLNLEYDILRVKTGIFLQGTRALMAPCMVLPSCQN